MIHPHLKPLWGKGIKPKTFFILLMILFSIFMYADVFACESGLHLEVGAGNNTNLTGSAVPWDDGGGMGAYLALRYETKRVVCHFSHYSQWDIGAPFNDTDESSLDHLGCAFRFKL